MDAREAWIGRVTVLFDDVHGLWLTATGTVLDQASQMADFVGLMGDLFT